MPRDSKPPPKLTAYTPRGGCSAKLGPMGLDQVLSRLVCQEAPALLTSYNGHEDAAVYRLTDDLAVVTTVDVNTPTVDDPFLFGRISACNALSDIYAMGAAPSFCLNIVGFPDCLELSVLNEILAGANEAVSEADAHMVGGHTIRAEQPWFGLSVTGTVHPERFWRNDTAKEGDTLILTKPIGNGVIATASKLTDLGERTMAESIRHASALNRTAAEALASFEVHAVTDVTGFGLLGHALEMMKGAGLTCSLSLAAVPLLPEALSLCEEGLSTGITNANRLYVEPHIRSSASVPEPWLNLLADPQTNGGLLAALPADLERPVLEKLHGAGVDRANAIGRCSSFRGAHLVLV